MSARLACSTISTHQAALEVNLSGSLLNKATVWAESVAYSISAGTLASAIEKFAAASDVVISFSGEAVTEGRADSAEPALFVTLEVKGVTHDQSIFISAIRIGRSVRRVTPLERNALCRPTLDDIRDVSDPLPFFAIVPV